MFRKVLLIVCLFLAFNLQAKEILRVNNSFHSPEFEFFSSIWKEVAQRNNLDVMILKTPNKRGLINTNLGLDHGDAARILNISKYYPNLVSVPEQIYTLEIVAVTKNKESVIKSLSDIASYHVGVIRGMKIAEIKAASVNPVSLIKATDYQSLLALLDKGRIDIAIVDKVGMLMTISKKQVKQPYYFHTPPLISVPLYMQLHKDSSQYVPSFEASLKQMKKDGSYQAILKKVTDIDVSSKVEFIQN